VYGAGPLQWERRWKGYVGSRTRRPPQPSSSAAQSTPAPARCSAATARSHCRVGTQTASGSDRRTIPVSTADGPSSSSGAAPGEEDPSDGGSVNGGSSDGGPASRSRTAAKSAV